MYIIDNLNRWFIQEGLFNCTHKLYINVRRQIRFQNSGNKMTGTLINKQNRRFVDDELERYPVINHFLQRNGHNIAWSLFLFVWFFLASVQAFCPCTEQCEINIVYATITYI